MMTKMMGNLMKDLSGGRRKRKKSKSRDKASTKVSPDKKSNKE